MVKFQLHHQQAYGLEIVARDPDSFAVTGVRCLFCVYLGREPAPENAQRQRRKGVQVWQKFAPQNYRSHHEGQHAAQWARYQDCSKAEKATFFGGRKSGEEVKDSGDGSGGGGGGVSSAAVAAAGVVVVVPAKEKRARGRPRTTANSADAGGVAPIQWDERSEERLMQLRFVSWFADPANESNVHDGWVLIASALAEEFGVPVDVEQCKAKFNLRKAPLQRRSRVEHEESSNTTSRNSAGGERQDPRSNRPQHSESERSVGIGVGVPSLPGAVVAVVAASTGGSRTNVEMSPAAVGTPKRLRGRPRRIEEEPIPPVTRSNNATISTLLNAEEPTVETPPPPPRKRQREHVQDASVMRREEAEVNGTSSSTNSSSNSSADVNTLLLTRILRVLEDHTEATRAQTRSNQELLAFLQQREF